MVRGRSFSDHDREFDDLFRRHLRNVYAALAQPAPDDLFLTNITTGPQTGPTAVRGLTSPVIDGRVTHYGEWSDSVDVRSGAAAGAMQRISDDLVRAIRVACDWATVYLRLEGAEPGPEARWPVRSRSPWSSNSRSRLVAWSSVEPIRWAAVDLVEIAVPILALGAQSGGRIRLSVLVLDQAGRTVERHPSQAPFDLDVPTRHLNAASWTV